MAQREGQLYAISDIPDSNDTSMMAIFCTKVIKSILCGSNSNLQRVGAGMVIQIIR